MAAQSISWLLDQVEDQGERESLTQIFPLIYEDLRQIAERHMHGEHVGHTLQPTALVNEAFVRIRSRGIQVKGREHALALTAIAMRRILVDHARQRSAQKRGGAARPFALRGTEASDDGEIEILELNELILRLADLDVRRARVVELRFFAGMSHEEIAVVLGVARSTVAADWSVARAWLRTQLEGERR